jgi:hypothetical protein
MTISYVHKYVAKINANNKEQQKILNIRQLFIPILHQSKTRQGQSRNYDFLETLTLTGFNYSLQSIVAIARGRLFKFPLKVQGM